jgi:hypothetical protein
MPTFNLHISDSKDADVVIEAANDHEAINAAFNALAKFACNRFPPPETISISVMDADLADIATLRLSFSIELAPGVVV